MCLIILSLPVFRGGGARQSLNTPTHTKKTTLRSILGSKYCVFFFSISLNYQGGNKITFWRLNCGSQSRSQSFGENFRSCVVILEHVTRKWIKQAGALKNTGSHFPLLNVLILHLNAAADRLPRRSLTWGNVFGFLVLSLGASAGNREVLRWKTLVSLCGTATHTYAPIYLERETVRHII